MENYVTFSEAALKSAIAIPREFPAISLIFHGKAISLPLECVGTLANSGGRYIAFIMMMSVVSQRPHRQYMVFMYLYISLWYLSNKDFVFVFVFVYGVTVRSCWPTRIRKWQLVSNNNILLFNTYYHKQISKILISAFNETFRQSSDPVYAHTPMRNVGGLRTFNPKLKDSAGGEVNKEERWPCLTLSVQVVKKSWKNVNTITMQH